MIDPNVDKSKTNLSRKGIERLDLLLLVVEALDLNGGNAMIWTLGQLGLEKELPNSVELWKARCHNPIRKVSRPGHLRPSNADALIDLLCTMANRLYPLLHQLLSSKEPNKINQQRWNLYRSRLKDLILERMNTRRSGVQNILKSSNYDNLSRDFIITLSLSTGKGGHQRLKASLMDH